MSLFWLFFDVIIVLNGSGLLLWVSVMSSFILTRVLNFVRTIVLRVGITLVIALFKSTLLVRVLVFSVILFFRYLVV